MTNYIISSLVPSALLLLTSLVITGSNNLADAQVLQCPNVAPCYCRYNANLGPVINCNGVPMENVKAIFDQIDPSDIYTLNLLIRGSSELIPTDLLGSSRVTGTISLTGIHFLQLEVDPDAFRASRSSLAAIEMSFLDHSQLTFDFLTGFSALAELRLKNSTNVNRSIPNTLPELPSLNRLVFESLTGLKEAFSVSVDSSLRCSGLTYFFAEYNSLDTNSMGNLLDWLVTSSSSTLRELHYGGNEMDSIPSQMASFPGVKFIYLMNNGVDMTVRSNSFVMSSNPSENQVIYLTGSRIVRVESDAFKGNYTSSWLEISSNSLTRFEESAFKAMLEDMSNPSTAYGYLSSANNPFDCYSDSCHLAWLLRDNRQLLGSFLTQTPPRCADGTLFSNLSPSLFVDCP